MKIVYVHHAEREHGNKAKPRREQDITEDGIKEAVLLSKKMHYLNPTAIYTSPYLRCYHTATILNKEVNVPIIKDDRFNEFDSGNETYKEFLERNISALKEIIRNYNKDDVILCVTSGVNLSAFTCYFSGNTPSNDTPKVQGLTISPVLFTTDDNVL